jgi:hypothetical protein
LNRHDEAFVYGEKAGNYAMMLMNKSQELCNLFINEIAKKKERALINKRNSTCMQSLDEIEEVLQAS